MTTDLFALLSIVALSVALVTSVSAYLRLQKKIKRLQDEEDEMKQHARAKAHKMLEHAQDAAFQIANEAIVKAEESKQLIHSKLEEVATKQIREYQKMIHNSSGDIEAEVARMISLKMDEEWKKAQVEIDAYRKQKEADLDQKASQVIKQLGRDVLGKTIDVSTHAQLLTEALERAKKEYGF